MSGNKKFIVQTEPGNADSLKEPVKIAFTITPIELDGPTHPYNAIAVTPTTFPVSTATSVTVELASGARVFFGTYRLNGKQVSVSNQVGPMLSPERAVTLTSSAAWRGPASCGGPASFVATNLSGSTTDIVAAVHYWNMAYHTVRDGCSIALPSSFQLQAYVVNDGIQLFTLLQPEDLTRPVFTSPIGFNSLPDSSTWILCQDDQGQIRLKNAEYQELGYPTKALAEPSSKKDPLSEILERLAVMERSIDQLRDDMDEGKRAITELRDQFSTSEESARASKEVLGRGVATVEAKAATLEGSFERSQARLSIVHKAVTDTQQLVAGMEKTISDLNRRLPHVESKAEQTDNRLSNLEESASRTQDRVVTVEKAVHQTQDHVSLVQQLVVSSNAQLSMMRQTGATAGVSEPVPPSAGLPPTGEKRNPAVEARVDTLERSVQEQRRALRTVERRLPKLETDLGAVQGSFASLEHRVSIIEAGSDDDEIRITGGPSSSAGGSPVMFPHHLADAPSTA